MQQKSIQERIALSLNAMCSDDFWDRCMSKSSCLDNFRSCGSYPGNQKELLINFDRFSGSP